MKEFRLCFVPLFVAVDAIGVLPAFRSLSQDMEPRQVRRVIFRCVATATAVALAFFALGTAILDLLNQYDAGWTAAAIVANILIAGIVFRFAGSIGRVLGRVGKKIVSKIAMLLLAAIAVVMVRKGIEAFLTAGVVG